jgi:hypothetical protein
VEEVIDGAGKAGRGTEMGVRGGGLGAADEGDEREDVVAGVEGGGLELSRSSSNSISSESTGGCCGGWCCC